MTPKRIEIRGGLLLRSELPAFLGITRGRVSQLAREGRLPDPALLTVGGSPLWRVRDVRLWQATTGRIQL